MAAPECLPLIFEPESRFFTDPVLVMDFQSLYPSIIIAHNYCYSTCLGKMQNIFRYDLTLLLTEHFLDLRIPCGKIVPVYSSICEIFACMSVRGWYHFFM